MTEENTSSASRPPPAMPSRADVVDLNMPIVLFLVLNFAVGLTWGIVAMTLWAIKAQISRRRRGLPLSRIMPLVVLYLLVRGTLGIIFDSGDLYFGIGIGVKGLAAVVLVVSVIIRRSAVGIALSYLLDLNDSIRTHRVYRSCMNKVTLGVAVAVLISTAINVLLLQSHSVNKFVLFRAGADWGLSFVTLVLVLWYMNNQLRRIPGFPGLMALVERRMAALGYS